MRGGEQTAGRCGLQGTVARAVGPAAVPSTPDRAVLGSWLRTRRLPRSEGDLSPYGFTAVHPSA